MELIERARIFATAAHAAICHKRKYTGEPYIEHPRHVVMLLLSVGIDDENMIAAAWLHDVVEDTGVTFDDIAANFNNDVLALLCDLTDISKPEDGNRAQRKAIDREHIAKASRAAKTIKLADLISNAASILRYDPDFAKVFLEEMRLLLEVLDGNHKLFEMAYHIAYRSWR